MRVLVAYASRSGGTAEIAERIGHRLREAGFEVDVHACLGAPDASGYDALVLGSALYARHWEPSAVDYLRGAAPALEGRPVRLFQSGPCGQGAEDQVAPTPRPVRRLVAHHHLAPPVTFGGRLDPDHPSDDWLQQWMTGGPRAGDWRDWSRIDRWADEVAAHVRPSPLTRRVPGAIAPSEENR